MTEKIELTLNPQVRTNPIDLRIGARVIAENGQIFEINRVEEERGDLCMRGKLIDDAPDFTEIRVEFDCKVISYSSIYVIKAVDMASWNNSILLKLKKVGYE